MPTPAHLAVLTLCCIACKRTCSLLTRGKRASARPAANAAGPYINAYGQEVRTKFSAAYRAMTDAFLALPICLPGTAVWKGYKGRLYIIKVSGRGRAACMQSGCAPWDEPLSRTGWCQTPARAV